MWLAIGVVALVGAAAWGPIMSDVEQAKYQVVEQHGAIEIRDYAPMIIAETEVSGERDQAINDGFRLIADYIFGNNTTTQKVAMTAPIAQQSSQKIAMTAPVAQQTQGNGMWTVHFVMPAEYLLSDLPKPNNEAVKLKERPASRMAAIRFSGTADEEKLATATRELQQFMTDKGLKPSAAPVYAFYNPPWTLPPLRRNEVLIRFE